MLALSTASLYLRIWTRRPTWVPLVYLDSPKWKEDVESRILPRLPADAVVLNRSSGPTSPKRSLAAQAYRHFGGSRAHCPIGLVFVRGARVRCFRFHAPYREAVDGDRSSLERVRDAFLAATREAHGSTPSS